MNIVLGISVKNWKSGRTENFHIETKLKNQKSCSASETEEQIENPGLYEAICIKEGDNLKVAVMELRLYAPWVHSLKEKRMVVKSLLGKIRSRYAVSAAETGEQDIHQTLVIGVAGIVAHAAQADSMLDDILAFVESSTEAGIVSVEREIR